jgi:hypothetical protein
MLDQKGIKTKSVENKEKERINERRGRERDCPSYVYEHGRLPVAWLIWAHHRTEQHQNLTSYLTCDDSRGAAATPNH